MASFFVVLTCMMKLYYRPRRPDGEKAQQGADRGAQL
jgi:hypothetical protein